jgi:hypothetical protein
VPQRSSYDLQSPDEHKRVQRSKVQLSSMGLASTTSFPKASTTSFPKKVLRLPCGSGGRAGNHCAAAFPAAAANNNGRDLLEMGIYLDRLLQVQMASVSEKCG